MLRYIRYAGILIIILTIPWLAYLTVLESGSVLFPGNQVQPFSVYIAAFLVAGVIMAVYGSIAIGSIRKEAIGQVFVIDHRDSDNAGVACYKGIKLRIASIGLLEAGDQVRITGTQSLNLSGFGVLFIGVKV